MNKNNRMSKRLLNYVIVLLVCLISSAESFAQGTKFQVKGNVTDASREPIAVSYTHLTLPTNREV